ncbi:MAG: energy transducer TonB [Bacteroidales bacterium]|nr:energy transducer TonB [Bacteroidales bacterium]
MEVKKNPKVNLENYRGTFILTGLIVALIVVSIIFGLSKANVRIDDLQGNVQSKVEEEQVSVTRQDVTPPPPPPEQQQISEVIEIVKDDVKITDDFNFDTEADDDLMVDFTDIEFDDSEGDVEEEPLVWAEQMPEFPGGEAALRQFIGENVVYPELAAENDIQGTVYIRFVVTKSGKVGEVQVTRGVDPLLDDEAVRVVKKLPNFKPGSQGGRAVPVWFSVPIVFQLNN